MTRATRPCRCLVLLLRASARQGVPLSPPQPMRQTLPQVMPPTGQIASPWARDIPAGSSGNASRPAILGPGIKRPG
jgi:hypothetical protein